MIVLVHSLDSLGLTEFDIKLIISNNSHMEGLYYQVFSYIIFILFK